jgi:simple sugar transport system permease protein
MTPASANRAVPEPATARIAGTPAPRRRGLPHVLIERREFGIALVGVAIFVYFASVAPNFTQASNLVTISQYVGPVAVIAAAEVMLLVCGEIDLSAGEIFTFTPFIVHFLVDSGVPIGAAMALALLLAAAVGVFNGLVTVLVGIPSFITTLATLFAVEGFILIVSGGSAATMPGGAPWSEILWAALLVLILYLVLTKSQFGLHTVAVGGNRVGAAESGMSVARVKVINFMLCAVFAGAIGIVDAIRITSLDPGQQGADLVFYALAAAIIGGTALSGGRGTIIGAAIGAVVLGILEIGFTMIGISANAFLLVLGVAILISMGLNVQLARLSRRRVR